jgi:hypothetical protein
MKGRVILFLFLLFAYASCWNSSNKTGEFVIPQEDSVSISEDERVSPETSSYIARDISSSRLLKTSGQANFK